MQQNNESQGMIMAMALSGAVVFFAFAFVFALAVFISILMTAVCLFAWKKPRRFMGETVTPEEAQAFVVRGIGGALLVPGFALFASGLFGIKIRPDYWMYLPLGGYALGSLVVTYHVEKAKLEAKQQEAAMQALLPPEPPSRAVRTIEVRSVASSPPVGPVQSHTPVQSHPQPEPFRFATWDDEEELRK